MEEAKRFNGENFDELYVSILTPDNVSRTFEGGSKNISFLRKFISPLLGASDFAKYSLSLFYPTKVSPEELEIASDYIVREERPEPTGYLTKMLGVMPKNRQFQNINGGNIFGIRPVLRYGDIVGKAKDVSQNDKLKVVEFGEYPQEIEKAISQSFFDECVENRRFIYTDKTYTIKVFINSRLETREFREIYDKETNSKYIYFQNNLIRVKPVRWILDALTNTAVAEKMLLGKKFGPVFPPEVYLNELNTYFNRDLQPSDVKKKLLEDARQYQNSDVEKCIKELYSLIEGLSIRDLVIAEIKGNVDYYNQKLEEIKSSLQSQERNNVPITFGINSKEEYKRNLIIKLEMLIDRVKNFKIKTKGLNESLEKIRILERILTDKSFYISELVDPIDLDKDFQKIREHILPSLPKEKAETFIESIRAVLAKHYHMISEYLDNLWRGISKNPPFNPNDDIEITIRRDIHPILLSLQPNNEKDQVLKAMKQISLGTSEAIESIHKDSNNMMIGVYLNEINGLCQRIRNKSNTEEIKERINEAISFDLSSAYDINDIFDILRSTIIKLNKIEIEVDEYLTKLSDLEGAKFNF